jgi:hypothetical protein
LAQSAIQAHLSLGTRLVRPACYAYDIAPYAYR